MSVYSQLVAAGARIESHRSDLYTPVTAESTRIVRAYRFRCNVSTFPSEGINWYEIPFAYDPFWQMRSSMIPNPLEEVTA